MSFTETLKIVFRGSDEGLAGTVNRERRGLTDLNRSASAATSGIKSFAKALGLAVGGGAIVAGFRSIVNEMDDMAKSAQKIGLTVEQLSALRHGADLSAVSFANLQTGLQQFAKRLAESATGTDKASKLLRGLGIDASQGTMPALLRLADVFASTQDGAAKTAAAAELMGQRLGPQLIPLLNNGSDGISHMMEEAERLGLVMDTKTAHAAERFDDNVTRLSGSLHGLAVTALSPAIVYLADWTDAVTDAIREGTGLAGVITNIEAAMWGFTTSKALNRIGVQIGTIKEQIAELQGTSGGAFQQGANWIERTLTPSAVGQKIDELKGKLKDLEVEKQKAIKEWGHSDDVVKNYEKRIVDLKKLLGDLGKTHTKTGAAVKNHTKEIKNQEKATLALAARYGSSVAQQEVYRQKLQEVTEAMRSQGATAEELAKAQQKVYEEVFGKGAKQVDAWATITEQALKRVDDSFVSMWESVISGTGNAMDGLKSLVTSTLAEIAHELITKKLVVSIGAVLGVNSAGAAAGTVGTAGGSGSSLGLLSSFGNMLTGTSIGGGIANTLFDVGSLAGIAPDTLANGLSGIAGTSNLAFGASGIAGALVGHFLAKNQAGQIGSAVGGIAGTLGGSALSGTIAAAATSAAGAATGAAVGSVVPVVGTIIGAAIGALAGNAFGGVKIPEVTVAARGGGIVPVSGHNLSSQQYDQAINTIDAVNQLVTGLVGAFGPEGQKAVAAVNLSGTKSGPGDLNAESKNLLKTDIQAAAAAGDQLAQYVSDQLGDFADSLEDTANEIGKAVAEFQGLQQIIANFDALGQSIGSTDEAALAAAKNLATLAGGVDQLAAKQSYYYDNILSDTDRLRIQFHDVEKKIVSFNDALGLTGDAAIDTKAELKSYIDGLDLQTKAGQQAYVQALNLAPAITTLADIFGQVGGASATAALSLSDFLGQLSDVSQSLTDTFASTRDSIETWGLSNEELYARTKKEADALMQTIGTITDPQQLKSVGEQIFADIGSGWGLLSDEGKSALKQSFLDYSDEVQSALQDRLDALGQQAVTQAQTMTDAAASFGGSVNLLQAVSQAMAGAGGSMQSAAAKFQQAAASMPRTINVTVRQVSSEVGA